MISPMAVATAGEVGLERAVEARQARGARAVALGIDLIVSSILYAIVNSVYGVPGYGVPGLALVLVWLAYVTVPEALYGATLGKMVLGLCVVRVDGRPLTLDSVAGRNIGRLLDCLPLLYLVGGTFVLLSGQSQRIGDMVAGTTVVGRAHALAPGDTRRPFVRAGKMMLAGIAALAVLTVAFDYFGRPPLVVEGAYRSGDLQMSTYSLGSPQWSLGEVTYPLTGIKSGAPCTGYVVLDWQMSGWDVSGWSESCPPLSS